MFVFFVLSGREEPAANGFDRRFCLGCESVATDVVTGPVLVVEIPAGWRGEALVLGGGNKKGFRDKKDAAVACTLSFFSSPRRRLVPFLAI
jgi:hypothetical protein